MQGDATGAVLDAFLMPGSDQVEVCLTILTVCGDGGLWQ